MLLPLMLACAEASLSKGGAGAEDAAPDEQVDTSASDDDTEEVVAPDHWTAEARLRVVDGAPAVEAAAVRVRTVRAEDAAVACESLLDTSAMRVGVPPDPAVSLWWEGARAPTLGGCAGAPPSLSLGIGVLLPDLRARLGAVGLDDAADSLYGAYLAGPDGVVWAFGAAGTEASMEGGSPAPEVPPDGTYTLVPLYALGLVGSDEAVSGPPPPAR